VLLLLLLLTLKNFLKALEFFFLDL
jgi:hypothetical protein